jgi:hypothetical protein
MKGNDDIHRRLTRGRARFKHGGDVDGLGKLEIEHHPRIEAMATASESGICIGTKVNLGGLGFRV